MAGGCAAAATAALAWRMPGAGAGQIALLVTWLIIVQASTLLSLIDLAAQRLPAVLVTATGLTIGVGVGVAAWSAHQPRWVLAAVLGVAGLGGIYLLLAVLVPSQVGMGDVRLSAVLGAALGIGGWETLLLGAVLPYVVVFPFALARLRRSPPSQRGQVPFGPFLAAGAIIATALTSG
jgi:leader peptidase (prepilin peptidase)/N-methyltransferase